MTIETATYVTELNASNPANTDTKQEGDDHLRLIKACLLASFPSVDTRNLDTTILDVRFGQCIRYDGGGLNVNVRARFSEYASTSDLTVPNTTYVTFAFPNTPTENGFGFSWTTPGKLTIADHNKYLAWRLRGVMEVLNPLIGDSVRVRVMKNAGTVVSGSFSFFLGQEVAATTFNNIDLFGAIPLAGLVATDVLYFEIGYVASGAVPGGIELLTGATIELYDMG